MDEHTCVTASGAARNTHRIHVEADVARATPYIINRCIPVLCGNLEKSGYFVTAQTITPLIVVETGNQGPHTHKGHRVRGGGADKVPIRLRS